MKCKNITKTILMSIHPEWADLIYKGKKEVEWRKRFPASFNGNVLVYETSPVKKITGIFLVEEVVQVDLKKRSKENASFVRKGCVALPELSKYAGTKNILYALVIRKAMRIGPQTMNEVFPNKKAPQSFTYI